MYLCAQTTFVFRLVLRDIELSLRDLEQGSRAYSKSRSIPAPSRRLLSASEALGGYTILNLFTCKKNGTQSDAQSRVISPSTYTK
jgi:hypothetical protein